MRKQTKIAAIVSAAALLAIGASMTSFAAWQETPEGSDVYAYFNRYSEIDMSEGWHRGNEGWTLGPAYWYFADEDGVMKRDELFEYNGSMYYVHPDGHRAENEWVGIEANDDIEMADERVSFDVVYYYFGSTGKAIQAKDADYEAVKLNKDNGVTATGTFVFDENGVMQVGLVDGAGTGRNATYYCVQKYDSLSIKLAAGKEWDYVTGQALNGWAYMDTEAIVEEDLLYREDYDDQEWFYFDGGKLVKNKQAKKIAGKYYSFDENGVLLDGDTPGTVATASNAIPEYAESDIYSYADGDGLSSTGNHFVNFKDYDWYYIVNIRNGNNRKVVDEGYGVIFNKNAKYDEDKVETKDPDQASRMISVGGKQYMIKADGVMATGAYKITNSDVTAWLADDPDHDGRATWNGIDYVIPTYKDANGKYHIVGCDTSDSIIEGKDYYLYFDDSTDLDGDRGELTVGRITYDNGDDGETTRFFTRNGMVDTWAIYGDYLYNEGLLYTSQDGDRYALVDLPNDANKNTLANGAEVSYMYRYPLKNNVPNTNEKNVTKIKDPKRTDKDKKALTPYLIVDYTGRVQKGYTSRAKVVTIDDGTKYDVINYVATINEKSREDNVY